MTIDLKGLYNSSKKDASEKKQKDYSDLATQGCYEKCNASLDCYEGHACGKHEVCKQIIILLF